jgi:hypothetical protein
MGLWVRYQKIVCNVLVFCSGIALGHSLHAQTPLGLGVAWKPNTEPDLAGYHIYYGPRSRVYTNVITVGPTATTARIEPLVSGASYYLTMTAFNSANVESLPTPELFYKAPVIITNRPPSITMISNQTLLEDTASASIKFTVSDPESPANALTVRARSSNPRLIPEQYILLGGTNNDRSLLIVPQLNQWGRADITIEATDPQGASTAVTFAVTVVADNDDPVVSPISNQTVNEDTPGTGIPFYVFDSDSPPEDLWLVAMSSDQTIVADDALVITGTGKLRTFSFTPVKNAYGSCIIDLFVVDPEGQYAWIWFNVAVRAVNDQPTLDPIPSFSVDEGSGPLTIPLSGISSGAANELQPLIVSAASSRPDIVPAPLVTYASPNIIGSLLLAPVAETNGTSVITVTVSDGQNTNGTVKQSFTVSVRQFNNPPVIYSLPDLAVLRLPNPLRLNFTVQDPDTSSESLSVTGQSSDPAMLPTSNLVFSGTGTQRTLTINPPLGRTGLVIVTVVVSDGESSVSASFYVLISSASS